MSTIELIVARADNGTIGSKGTMPWHIPEDLKHFKAVTMGCPVIMGRKTWQSIGRPLPGRTNIVITRSQDFEAPGATVVHDFDAAVAAAGDVPRIFVIGGADLYRQTLSRVDVAWITQINATVEGDAHFEALDPATWSKEVLSTMEATDTRPALSFERWERK